MSEIPKPGRCGNLQKWITHQMTLSLCAALLGLRLTALLARRHERRPKKSSFDQHDLTNMRGARTLAGPKLIQIKAKDLSGGALDAAELKVII